MIFNSPSPKDASAPFRNVTFTPGISFMALLFRFASGDQSLLIIRKVWRSVQPAVATAKVTCPIDAKEESGSDATFMRYSPNRQLAVRDAGNRLFVVAGDVMAPMARRLRFAGTGLGNYTHLSTMSSKRFASASICA